MGSIAERVYTGQADIERLESRITELPDEARVELTLVDGRRMTGVVVARPTIQTYRDSEGREGINGHVRIDEDDDGDTHYVWLDQIAGVTSLGSH